MGAALDHLTVVVEVAVVVDAIELQKAVLRVVAILHGLVVANAIRLAFSVPEIIRAPPVRPVEKVAGGRPRARGGHGRPRGGSISDRSLRGLCSRFVVGVV